MKANTIDIETWNRKEHFEFFSKYDNPFFGIVTEIDCDKAYNFSKKNNISFFANYLHKSISAVNKTNELKYRIKNNKVVIYDIINAGATIGRKDGTFGFALIPYSTDFKSFNNELLKEVKNVESSKGLRVNDDAIRRDLIHYSTLPWSKFTGLSHARNFNTDDTVPKITFGKIFEADNIKKLPISIEAHHGLVDGLHISQYLEEFQKLMNE